MPLGGSTWAHGPDEEEAPENVLPQNVMGVSITEMPVRQLPPPPPTEQQAKLRREVAGPTGDNA